MVIKQKRHQNRKFIEYAPEELETLTTIVFIICFIDGLGGLVMAILGGVVLFNLTNIAAIVWSIPVAIIAVRIIGPLAKIFVRHHQIDLAKSFKSERLAKWYEKLPYVKMLIGQIILMILDLIVIISSDRWMAEPNTTAACIAMIVGVANMVVTIAIGIASHSIGEGTPDLIHHIIDV